MPDFAIIESSSTALMRATLSTLSESERGGIQDYIDVGEYGLALKTAVAIYTEEEKEAPLEVVNMVVNLARLISIDPEPFLKRLRSK
ncbi:hypothetical protein [Chitinimonas koreensis]|uniref:hypothetical protein n=1 Tax=Chitinimonas koreensis TaxID=356302 RepID=UPI00165423F9|nr:hypothetical protein [Chitinimonas koreensis]QNM98710.1 hypothetical protein H9L41_11100 [Chitinimonas koreensis]